MATALFQTRKPSNVWSKQPKTSLVLNCPQYKTFTLGDAYEGQDALLKTLLTPPMDYLLFFHLGDDLGAFAVVRADLGTVSAHLRSKC